jgi:eukaryotic-like serine/threonine-protein kinase
MTRRRAPSLAPGAHLNNMFEIVQPIAADETGEVYEARNIQTKDPVAIRVVRPELARDETIPGAVAQGSPHSRPSPP